MRRSNIHALVGDIGGTNARFAVMALDEARPSIICARSVLCRDYASLAEAADAFLASTELTVRPALATIAVAGPVADGAARLTNVAWRASEAELLGMGFSQARLVNDFEALATGVADLKPEDSVVIGEDKPGLPRAPVLVAGTGFGLAGLVRGRGGAVQVIASEGGHASFAPVDDIEIDILRALQGKHGRVSIERLLSGPGLLDLYRIMAEILALPAEPEMTPEDITQAAAEQPRPPVGRRAGAVLRGVRIGGRRRGVVVRRARRGVPRRRPGGRDRALRGVQPISAEIRGQGTALRPDAGDAHAVDRPDPYRPHRRGADRSGPRGARVFTSLVDNVISSVCSAQIFTSPMCTGGFVSKRTRRFFRRHGGE